MTFTFLIVAVLFYFLGYTHAHFGLNYWRVMPKKLRKLLRTRSECFFKRCTYFDHYLAYGPAELTHEGYHAAERLAGRHFENCSYSGVSCCPTCSRWERTVRA